MKRHTLKGKKERTVAFDPATIEQINQIAEQEGTNFSIVVRQLVGKGLEARNGAKP